MPPHRAAVVDVRAPNAIHGPRHNVEDAGGRPDEHEGGHAGDRPTRPGQVLQVCAQQGVDARSHELQFLDHARLGQQRVEPIAGNGKHQQGQGKE